MFHAVSHCTPLAEMNQAILTGLIVNVFLTAGAAPSLPMIGPGNQLIRIVGLFTGAGVAASMETHLLLLVSCTFLCTTFSGWICL